MTAKRKARQEAVLRLSETDGWPLLDDLSEQPTMVIRPSRLREEAAAARRSRRTSSRRRRRWSSRRPTGTAAERSCEEEQHSRRLAVSTAIFAAATGLSRVLGLVREVVASYYFGASGRINAFTVAFQIPNLIRALVADAALSSAFVPVFSELLEKGERKRAWRVASTLFWLMLLGLRR